MNENNLRSITVIGSPIKPHRIYVVISFFICIIGIFVGYNFWLKHMADIEALKDRPGAITRQLPPKNQQKVIRILSVSGGGIYGILPAYALQYLEEKTGKPINELFDIMIGTSTGSIPVTLLTAPNDSPHKMKYTAHEVLEFYNHDAGRIFYNPWYNKLLTLDGLIGPKYLSTSRQAYIKEKLGDTKFDNLKNNVIIPSYAIERKKPLLFINWKSQTSDHENENFYVSDILLGAISPPYFFAPTTIYSQSNSYVLSDAAIYMDNPALAALLEGLSIYPNHSYVLVSLGTGVITSNIIAKRTESWGLIQWLGNIFPLSIHAGSEFSETMVKNYFLARESQEKNFAYYSFNMPVPKDVGPLDDTSPENIARLNALGKKMVEENKMRLDKLADALQRAAD